MSCEHCIGTTLWHCDRCKPSPEDRFFTKTIKNDFEVKSEMVSEQSGKIFNNEISVPANIYITPSLKVYAVAKDGSFGVTIK